MTIQEWNIVISASILALMTGGGLWLKYVVDQQLKAKDTAIQALDEVVKLKDAQIAALEGNTAPAIAKAYSDMREHANLMTGESQRLSVQLEDVGKKQQADKEMFLPKLILAQVTGLQLASKILEETVWRVIVPDGQAVEPRYLDDEFEPLCDGIVAASERINSTIEAHLDKGSNLINKR